MGDMVLFDGPLGQVLGGSDPYLVFGEQRAMVTTVHNDGQNVTQKVIGVQLPGAASADEEKALGVHWDVEKDELVSHGGPVRYSHKCNAI